jgi:hypothetical protein
MAGAARAAVMALALAASAGRGGLWSQDAGAKGASASAMPASAPADPGIPSELRGEALSLTLSYRVISRADPEQSLGQTAERLILPNRTFQLRMTGTNLVVVVQLTPLVSPSDETDFILKAFGQVWMPGPSTGTIAYYASTSTMRVGYGETALFYPLGTNIPGKDNIEISILIDKNRNGK